MAEIQDTTGYKKMLDWWKHEVESMGELFTTRKRAAAKDTWILHERRENKDMRLPEGVVERRQLNDSLHVVEQKLEAIEKNTRHIPSVMKSLRNMFSSFVGDYDTHVEPKTQPRKK